MRLHREPTSEFFDRETAETRLRELLLYIPQKCVDDPGFGAIKINKILSGADRRSYILHGAPITGVEYLALDNGPGPRRLLPVKNEMLASHEIAEEKRMVGEHAQHRIVALRDPDLSVLTAQNIAIVDSVIKDMWGKTGAEVSAESHGRAWRIAHKAKVPIPYASAFLSDEKTARPEDVARAEELAEQLGWSR